MSTKGFTEQGNMAINFLGTWEQKENETWNMGTKAYFREQATPKSKKYFQATREYKDTWEQGKCPLPPPPPPRTSCTVRSRAARSVAAILIMGKSTIKILYFQLIYKYIAIQYNVVATIVRSK